jgi:flagellar L-ring protein precursor FlgH
MDQFIGNNEVNNEFDGEGTTTRSGRLNATITATVMEMLANGNLLLEGTRSIRINHETQLMRVKGVARPRDIDANNQINSKLLADGQIKFDGNGAVDRVNKPGVITQLINVIF